MSKEYIDAFEEPAPKGYDAGDSFRRTPGRGDPLRIRKNPFPASGVVKKGGNDPIGYGEFRDWATKEWAVYIGKISVLREEASVCFLKHGPIAQYKCQEQIREYLRHANKQNLFEAKRRLMSGQKLVE